MVTNTQNIEATESNTNDITLDKNQTQQTLTREQKQAFGLLSIGTFLEYFDLMLFVHMAVLLNELFFPKTDPEMASLLSTAAFCSTYLMRPIGALIFGWIGDNIGRRHIVIITTFLMSGSSLLMFILPTYAQIGISAAWLVTICRMIQGMSSMGEIMGAVLYLVESVKAPKCYPTVAFIRIIPGFSTFAALGIATIAIKYGFNWRYAFLLGSIVALVGSVARSTLRETPDFVDARKRLIRKSVTPTSKKVVNKIAISYFFLECTWPLWVYIIYIYSANALKNDFNFSADKIIEHNLYMSIIGMLSSSIIVYLSTKIHPLTIMKTIIVIVLIFILPLIILLQINYSVLMICVVQVFLSIFAPTTVPGDPIVLKYFPILQRFLSTSVIYSLSRIVVYLITSIGAYYVLHYFGILGLLIIIIPIVILYSYGLRTFILLEKEGYNYSQKIV